MASCEMAKSAVIPRAKDDTVSLSSDLSLQEICWKSCPSLLLNCHMGEYPLHFPRTSVRVTYDGKAIYLFFQVEDAFVLATAAEDQDSVCGDSCVEFFFSPGPDSKNGYFNLEMNCGGTMLFHFHPTSVRDEVEQIEERHCSQIRRMATLPARIQPEMPGPVTWAVLFSVPFSLLQAYSPSVQLPQKGSVWRANFYKCADNSSHPHWLTWSPVSSQRPDFHLPACFGYFCFG